MIFIAVMRIELPGMMLYDASCVINHKDIKSVISIDLSGNRLNHMHQLVLLLVGIPARFLNFGKMDFLYAQQIEY